MLTPFVTPEGLTKFLNQHDKFNCQIFRIIYIYIYRYLYLADRYVHLHMCICVHITAIVSKGAFVSRA